MLRFVEAHGDVNYKGQAQEVAALPTKNDPELLERRWMRSPRTSTGSRRPDGKANARSVAAGRLAEWMSARRGRTIALVRCFDAQRTIALATLRWPAVIGQTIASEDAITPGIQAEKLVADRIRPVDALKLAIALDTAIVRFHDPVT